MSRLALIVPLLGLAAWATGAETDDDDHEDIIPIAQAPEPVRQTVMRERMDHAERILHEMERYDGHFKAEFNGPDGEGFIEIAGDGTVLRRVGACQSWPVIAMDALPAAARSVVTRMIGTARLERLECQPPTSSTDRRPNPESIRYRAVFLDDGLCTAITVTANGELVQLHTSRKD